MKHNNKSKDRFEKLHNRLVGLNELVKTKVQDDFLSLVTFEKEIDRLWMDLFEVRDSLKKEDKKKWKTKKY